MVWRVSQGVALLIWLALAGCTVVGPAPLPASPTPRPTATAALTPPAPTPQAARSADARNAALLFAPYLDGLPYFDEALDPPGLQREYFGCVHGPDRGEVVSYAVERNAESIRAAFEPYLAVNGLETDGWQEFTGGGFSGRVLELLAEDRPDEWQPWLLSLRVTVYESQGRSNVWAEVTWAADPQVVAGAEDRAGAMLRACPGEEWWLSVNGE